MSKPLHKYSPITVLKWHTVVITVSVKQQNNGHGKTQIFNVDGGLNMFMCNSFIQVTHNSLQVHLFNSQ